MTRTQSLVLARGTGDQILAAFQSVDLNIAGSRRAATPIEHLVLELAASELGADEIPR